MKRTGAFLLAVLMLLSSLTACSDNASDKETDQPAVQDTVTADTGTSESDGAEETADENSRANIPDNLPEITFDGQEFRAAQQISNKYEFYSEELNGEGANDAVYNRNIKIEDRFDISITSVDYESLGAITSDVAKLVTAGTDAYEVASHCAWKSSTPIRAGVYRNWNEVDHVDFTQPWWNQLANESNTINGILYTATGDINISSLLNTYAMFFNIDLAADYGITPDMLYNYVYEGKWTIDKLIETTSSIYVDTDGDGEKGDEDVFGYAAHPGISSDAWLAAFDQPITGKDENGNPTVVFMTDKTVAAFEKIFDFYYNSVGTYAMAAAEYEVTMFVNGDVIMIPSIFNDAFNSYRFMESAYGIVPYPKWDEAQERYLTNARDQYTVLGIPAFKNDDSLEFIGIITEALAAESYRSVFPQYYDIALKGKYSVDKDTANMVDLVLAGRNFDFSFLFGDSEFQGLPYMFRDMLREKVEDISSRYAKIRKALNKSVEKIAGYYTPEE
ncbi:MAG: hypothetical protein IJ334_17565 [Clostridia bacterium]|nr:hypothetical protein [Clostridia bacterium]